MFDSRGGTAPPPATAVYVKQRGSRHRSQRPQTQTDIIVASVQGIDPGNSFIPLSQHFSTGSSDRAQESPRIFGEEAEEVPWPWHGGSEIPSSINSDFIIGSGTDFGRPSCSPGKARMSSPTQLTTIPSHELLLGGIASTKKQNRRLPLNTEGSSSMLFGRISPSELGELETNAIAGVSSHGGSAPGQPSPIVSPQPKNKMRNTRRDKPYAKVASPLINKNFDALANEAFQTGRLSPPQKGSSISQLSPEEYLQSRLQLASQEFRPITQRKSRKEKEASFDTQKTQTNPEEDMDNSNISASSKSSVPITNSIGRVVSARSNRPLLGSHNKKDKRNRSANPAVRRQREVTPELVQNNEDDVRADSTSPIEESPGWRRHTDKDLEINRATTLRTTEIRSVGRQTSSPISNSKTSQWLLDNNGNVAPDKSSIRPPSRQRHAFPTHLSEESQHAKTLSAFTPFSQSKPVRGPMQYTHPLAESSRKITEKNRRPVSRHKPPDRSLFLEVPAVHVGDIVVDDDGGSPPKVPIRGVQQSKIMNGRDFRDNPDADGFSKIPVQGPPTFNVEITNSALESDEFRPSTEGGHKVPKESSSGTLTRSVFSSPDSKRPMSRNTSRSLFRHHESLNIETYREASESKRWQIGWQEGMSLKNGSPEYPLSMDGFQPQASADTEDSESWAEGSLKVEDTESHLFDTTLEQEFLSLFAQPSKALG